MIRTLRRFGLFTAAFLLGNAWSGIWIGLGPGLQAAAVRHIPHRLLLPDLVVGVAPWSVLH